MAKFFKEESRTFNEYLIVPGYSSSGVVRDTLSGVQSLEE